MENRHGTPAGGLTRRSFLVGSGVAACAAALTSFGAGSAFAAEEAGGDAVAQTVGEEGSADPIPTLEAPAQWDKEADVVVVGTGGGGLAASIYLAQQGLNVVTIEKTSTYGGSTKHAGNIVSPGGTRIQNEMKYVAYGLSFPYDPQECADMQVKKNEGNIDRDLMYRLAVGGPECFDWMEDLGVVWECSRGSRLNWPGAVEGLFAPLAISPLCDFMYNKAVELGVEFVFNTRCENLVMDGGRVTGIKVSTPGGAGSFIHAPKAVILTAGGFALNRAMLAKYCPSGLAGAASCYTMPSDTGECTRMALGAGADMTGFDSYKYFDGGIDAYSEGGEFHHYLYAGDNQLSRQPWLSIDRAGNRHAYYSAGWTGMKGTPLLNPDGHQFEHTALEQVNCPGKRRYVIFDDNYEENMVQIDEFPCRKPITPDSPNIERLSGVFEVYRDWHNGVRKSLEDGYIKKADTLEELADLLGLDQDVVLNAVDNWNAMCEKGEDPDWNYDPAWLIPVQKPPYYGIKIGGQLSTTHCGLRVNTDLQVIDTDGKVIPGLYAGFHTAGGQTGNGSTDMMFLGTLGLSFAGGYVAAQGVMANE